jgi:tetratricopeptide (TPR) repeat protein
MKRAGLVAGTLVCLALATLVALLAVDVAHWRDALRADDVRYRDAPAADDLWQAEAQVPLDATRKLLDIDDDLRTSHLEDATLSDTKLMLKRADARARLERIAATDDDPARRSRAMTLLGVIYLATPVADSQEQLAALKTAVANFQRAIALDPNNADAKFNLEYALRQGGGGLAARGGPAPDTSGGPGGSRGAATSPPGSGY